MKLITTFLRLLGIRRGFALGDQMEYGLIHGAGKNLADDLKIESEVAIKLGIGPLP
jgi:hypothetical protein